MDHHSLLLAMAGLPLAVSAQIQCNRPVGPDLQISDITGVTNYAAADGRDAFSVGTTQTDSGSVWISYAPTAPAHPVIGLGLYRLSTVNGATRFEQVGQSWLFHSFCALAANIPCNTCVQPPDCSHLGVGCSTTDTASRTGSQIALGPRWQVNPSTGIFAYPPANPAFSGPIARRLQASLADLNTTDQFFVEALAIAPDDAAAGNGVNNAAYRPVLITGGPADFTMAFAGSTHPGQNAFVAWEMLNPDGLCSSFVATSEGGRVHLITGATPIGAGLWRYEYALYNLNSDAGVGAFAVPLSGAAALANPDFHSVPYTDGDGVNSITRDGSDWVRTRTATAVNWSTTPYATNPNANALLWGTLYNFRFDTDVPPSQHYASITLWKTPGETLPMLAFVPDPCYANCDGSTIEPRLNVLDFGCFLAHFAAGNPTANCDGSTTPPVLNVLDFGCFLNKFVAGCP